MEITRILSTYKQIAELFAGVAEEALNEWQVLVYRPGEKLCGQEEPLTLLQIVVEGIVQAEHHVPAGEGVVLARMASGHMIGDLELLLEKPVVCQAVAVVPTTVLATPVEKFRRRLESDLVYSRMLNMQLADKLYQSSVSSAEHALVPLKQRLLKYWDERLSPLDFAGQPTQELPFSSEETARQLRVTSRSVNRIMKEWKEQGILKSGRHRVTVTERTRAFIRRSLWESAAGADS
ncbi:MULTISPECIES: Crp/Fnr family transcriptional regulator [Paenibacillus]|uniref:Crp/Fnr family transcriptional regulator n=1 Tax=Paenibacillus TaxID=44249 RepID=UPI0022B875FA|nr:Crp/Fnr family transcriptional regulator [Paenibacillus caseinilyticus]MCZ8521983.1 Crp/Fnr family transcriptional regulator [Paenibacillus caseinilyticus]